MSPTTPLGRQTLTLNGLRFDANLGILEQEKVAPQPIQVDAELNLGPQPLLPKDDDIFHVLDYRKVRRIIIDECTAEHVNLLESLIGKLAQRLPAARRAGRAREDRQARDLRGLRGRDPHRSRGIVIRGKIAPFPVFCCPAAALAMNAVWIDEAPVADASASPLPANSMKIEARNAQARETPVPRGGPRHRRHYNTIEEGDKRSWSACRGGKDSYGLLDILLPAQGARAPIHFDIVAVNLDQKQPRLPRGSAAPKHLSRSPARPSTSRTGTPHSIVKRVIPEGKTTLRPVQAPGLRRGILYRVADELGATEGRAGPPPRRHAADLLPQHVLRGPSSRACRRSW